DQGRAARSGILGWRRQLDRRRGTLPGAHRYTAPSAHAHRARDRAHSVSDRLRRPHGDQGRIRRRPLPEELALPLSLGSRRADGARRKAPARDHRRSDDGLGAGRAEVKENSMPRTIEQVVTFRTTPERLYRLYLSPRQHAAACGGWGKAKIQARKGGRMQMAPHITGTFLSLVPGKLIVQTWRGSDWKRSDLDSEPRHVCTISFPGTSDRNVPVNWGAICMRPPFRAWIFALPQPPQAAACWRGER